MTGASPSHGVPAVSGYLNINKPPGWTSTDVVRRVKRLTGIKKVGHGGTLDPIATGVLPVCLGAATRFADAVLLGTKAYLITVRLGAATDTFDSTGTVTHDADASSIGEDQVRAALPRFTGVIQQAPPAYSALKRQGRPLYDLARAGVRVETVPRQVEVLALRLVRWSWPEFDLAVECGHGFYARSLANDIGESLGSAAHLSGLLRSRAGRFELKDAVNMDELERRAGGGHWQELLLPIDFTLHHLNPVTLDPLREEMVLNGQALPAGDVAGGPEEFAAGDQVRAYSREGRLIAILRFEQAGSRWRPDKVIHAL